MKDEHLLEVKVKKMMAMRLTVFFLQFLKKATTRNVLSTQVLLERKKRGRKIELGGNRGYKQQQKQLVFKI
jgi:hypothetical protein